jgi:multimeric flavodoxin WrbA
MKRCPKCTVTGESDDTRFCPGCGAELFFESRFGNSEAAMKTVVINGTEVKGCTYHIKEAFLEPLRNSKHDITEFYLPKDMPHFCTGCKVCFIKNEDFCPHAKQVFPIWTAMLEADLIVITAPVYGLGIPAGLKALLDHLCAHWMVHRPNPVMFGKQAVVLTNCIGPPIMAKSAQRDIVNALSWMGVSSIKRLGFGLLEGVIWDELSEKRRSKIENKAISLGKKCTSLRPARKSLKTRFKFWMCKVMQKKVMKRLDTPSADNLYWIEQGWLKR